MIKTYKANPEKSWSCGRDPDWTMVTQENGIIVSCIIGNHYAGCSCRLDERPESCTDEKAMQCVTEVISYLSDGDKNEIGNVVLKKRTT